ncbi:glycosyltransferase family 8 protein [Hortaea werneckii]|nr:glycosyltransferase family 8 protein [Hortaea werneckii]
MIITSRIRGKPFERLAVAAALAFTTLYFLTFRHAFGESGQYITAAFTATLGSKSRHIELSEDASWKDFAYCTYATAPDHLCNSVMLLESLHRAEAKADRLLLYSNQWSVEDDSAEASLLRKARDQYDVKLQPIGIWQLDSVEDLTWAAGFTKLLSFNQTQYKRVLSLDSDGTVLRSMDELFLTPSAPVAMPRAYWLKDTLNAQMALVQPSEAAFAAIQKQIARRVATDYDMEIINAVYGDSCAVLPHRPYTLLSGEFRNIDHTAYLGNKDEAWDAERQIRQAKYVHFSDWPLPKPWQTHADDMLQDLMPKCGGSADCAERKIWLRLYEDFRERRESVCGVSYATWKVS